MSAPIRFLTSHDAEVLARTSIDRTSSKGCVEVHGLTWKSDALLGWELTQRDLGHLPKVEVRIDELDLSVVYVDVPERGVGPFRAISRQPNFTQGLSVYELNKLRKLVKDKELADRLGRLSDEEATRLRTEYYAELGRAHDPASLKRLTDLVHQMNRKRLIDAGIEPMEGLAADQLQLVPPKPPGAKRPKAPMASGSVSKDRVLAPMAQVSPIVFEPPAPKLSSFHAQIHSPTARTADAAPHPTFPSINVKRKLP